MANLGRRTSNQPTYHWLTRWAADGHPLLQAEDMEWLGTIIESETIQPAKVHGSPV